MEIAGIATLETIFIEDDKTLLDAVEIMVENNIRRLPVLDSMGQITGMITVKDIISVLAEENLPTVLSISVQEFMSSRPIVIDARASVQEAVNLMDRNNVGALLLVTDQQGTLGGIVTERDIVKHFAGSLADASLEEFFTSNVITIEPTKSIKHAIKSMAHNKIRRLVVSSDHETVEGILTASDILKVLYQRKDSLLEKDSTLLEVKVSEIATTPVITAERTASVKEIVNLMMGENIGAVPITSNKKLVGIFTEKDLLRMISMYNLLPE